jgi:hypothetical protein
MSAHEHKRMLRHTYITRLHKRFIPQSEYLFEEFTKIILTDAWCMSDAFKLHDDRHEYVFHSYLAPTPCFTQLLHRIRQLHHTRFYIYE